MSKARTLADFISDGSEFADGTISVAEVSGAAPLASPTFTGTVNVTTLDASSYVYTDHLIVRPDAPNYIQLDGSYPDGTWNTALGERAGDAWATGSNNNVAIGYASLSNSGTADYNTAVGAISLGSLYGSTAQHNTGIGSEAGKGITTGISNTAIGSASMANFSANLTGNYNVGVGRLSSYSNTSGSFNVAIGTEALRENETGESNTAVGYTAGYNSTGTSNTFIGSNRQYLKGAGYDMTTGDKNVIIGPFSGNSGGLDIRTSDNNIVLADGDGTPRLHIDSSGNADITGSTATTNVNLNAIAATISDTAVDIFVYDTRKDSDGGAWRKRTQHTSWYNETLNTSTRGSRKEFPAVAVIVADNVDHTVTIYDGDDPSLPMWMVFTDWDNRPTNRMIGTGDNGTVTACLAMLNGKLAVGVEGAAGSAGSWDGLYEIDFLKDHAIHRNIVNTYGVWDGNIATRNSGGYPATNPYSVPVIVNSEVNDVAMTVLPNAPIDAATGLPVPTIAVATDGGVSVIKDDGTVVDITSDQGGGYSAAASITFTSAGQLRFSRETGVRKIETFNIPSSDTSSDMWLASSDEGTTFWYTDYGATSYGDLRHLAGSSTARLAQDHIATNYGLTLVDENLAAPAKGMVAYTTSDYATGWMNGDIKLATLSDTDDTNVTGSELVTNGTFDSSTNWSANQNWTIGSGVASCTSGTNSYLYTVDDNYMLQGKTYTVSFDITSVSAGSISVYVDGDTSYLPSFSTVGTHSATFTPNTNGRIVFQTSTSFVGSIDNVSVRLAEEDRSVNGNGLQVFGTVTKSAVATGADLVAYSGFSASNYLQQPYNSDLDFGTGDFCFTMWLKSTAQGTYYVFQLNDADVTNSTTIHFLPYYNGGILFNVGNNWTASQGNGLETGVWTHYAALRRNGQVQVYKNGVLVNYFTSTGSLSNSDNRLTIGNRNAASSNAAWRGSIALFRISATAPSPEQIKKIYEDEKVLFQEGAQATLYGSSDAVTALAYDDSTNLLHVGTSAGRSVFQGLRRVDNTTTAVGAAISASNGLVADE